MKIAIGYFGTVSGLTGTAGQQLAGQNESLKLLSNSFQTNIIDCNTEHEIDIFVHSWSVNKTEQIIEALHPKVYKIEPQIDINIPNHLPNVPRVFNAYSRWYTTKELSNLISVHESLNGKYDLIMISRFDVIWNTPFLFSSLDLNSFYISNVMDVIGVLRDTPWGWPHTKTSEISDHWFISNSDLMHKFCTVYKYLNEYTLPDQCPRYNYISQHMICKWHLDKIGITPNIKFTKTWYKNLTRGDYSLIRHNN